MSEWVTLRQEEWGTAQDIAEHLAGHGVSVNMVRDWAADKRVRSVRVGRRVYYHVGEVKVAEAQTRGRGRKRALLDRR